MINFKTFDIIIYFIKKYCTQVLIIFCLLMGTSCKTKMQNIIVDGAELVLVSDNYEFTEGPATDKDGNVFFTDQPNDRILKWEAKTNLVSEYMKPSGG